MRIALTTLVLAGYLICYVTGYWHGNVEGYRSGAAAGSFQVRDVWDWFPPKPEDIDNTKDVR